ncbi:MAG TPA: hypothetical protein EYP57_01210 [Thermodesulfobacteriaceae bacterium]|nr:hypothetical protein [Thermodesulfobacteriaceae bacterium]
MLSNFGVFVKPGAVHIKAQQGTSQFIGQNKEILKLKDSIAHFVQLDCNMLITGKTGTGKELVARTIYELSPRSDKRFLPLKLRSNTGRTDDQ